MATVQYQFKIKLPNVEIWNAGAKKGTEMKMTKTIVVVDAWKRDEMEIKSIRWTKKANRT